MAGKKNKKEETGIEKVEGNTIVINDAEKFSNHLQKVTDQLTEGKYDGISIDKATIKNDLFLQVEYSEMVPDGTNTVKKDCTAPVHDDLKISFKKLDEHLGRITEQFNGQGEIDFININCKGFEVILKAKTNGIALNGYRGLDSKKYLPLNSPIIKWGEVEAYEYINELAEVIEECKHEVMLYLFEGKHQPSAQLDLFDEGGEEDHDEENNIDQ